MTPWMAALLRDGKLAAATRMFYFCSMNRAPVPSRRCLTAAELDSAPDGRRVAVAGIVICRQRPGTAKGVIFLTLEDETGVANIVVWAKIFERFRRAVIAGRCLKITGRLQRDSSVIHIVAEQIEDISALLDRIVAVDSLPAPKEWPPGGDSARTPALP